MKIVEKIRILKVYVASHAPNFGDVESLNKYDYLN